MAGYVITMAVREGLSDSERQRRIAAAFRLLMIPMGEGADWARGADIESEPEAKPYTQTDGGKGNES